MECEAIPDIRDDLPFWRCDSMLLPELFHELRLFPVDIASEAGGFKDIDQLSLFQRERSAELACPFFTEL